jgi:Zn-dependent protease
MRFHAFPLGRVLGIEVRIDASWLLVAALMTTSLMSLLSGWHPDWSPAMALAASAGGALLFFASVLAHELSHALVARAYGIPVRHITLFLFGGVASIAGESPSPRAEILIAGAGPVASAVLATLFTAAGVLMAGDALSATSAADLATSLGRLDPLPTVLLLLGSSNASVALFNLVPGFPLDGGRVLRALLWKVSGDLRSATRYAALVGQCVAWALVMAGALSLIGANLPLVGGGIGAGLWLAAIGFFLRGAAVHAYEQATIEQALEGLRVAHLMRRPASPVAADMPLDRLVAEWLLGTGATSCPVVGTGGVFLGVARFARVCDLPPDRWHAYTTRDVVDIVECATPSETVTSAFRRLVTLGEDALPVVSGGQLVGLLYFADVLRWLELRRTTGSFTHAAMPGMRPELAQARG